MGSDSGPTDAQKRADVRKEEELTLLRAQEQQRIKAAGRKRRGRASLISGSATGLPNVQEENL